MRLIPFVMAADSIPYSCWNNVFILCLKCSLSYLPAVPCCCKMNAIFLQERFVEMKRAAFFVAVLLVGGVARADVVVGNLGRLTVTNGALGELLVPAPLVSSIDKIGAGTYSLSAEQVRARSELVVNVHQGTLAFSDAGGEVPGVTEPPAVLGAAVLWLEAGTNVVAPRIETAGLAEAVCQADVIMCATPARTPYLRAEWVRPGTHVSCVGADKPGKQEAESALLAGARVVVDDVRQCLTVGECEIPHAEGVLSAELDEIGAVIAGDAPSRTSDDEITVFDSTGLSLQDLATIARIVSRAEAEGVGTQVAL